jgi:hypothetical protein
MTVTAADESRHTGREPGYRPQGNQVRVGVRQDGRFRRLHLLVDRLQLIRVELNRTDEIVQFGIDVQLKTTNMSPVNPLQFRDEAG